jgi:ribosomal protein L30E
MAGIFLRGMEETQLKSGLDELRKNLKTKKLVFGTDRALKLLKQGRLVKIFIASNASKEIKEDCVYYSGLSGVELENLDIQNDELGILCKRPHAITVIGLLK